MASLVPSTGGGIVDVLYEITGIPPRGNSKTLTTTTQEFLDSISQYTFIIITSSSAQSAFGDDVSGIFLVSYINERTSSILGTSNYRKFTFYGERNLVTIMLGGNGTVTVTANADNTGNTGTVKIYGIR